LAWLGLAWLGLAWLGLAWLGLAWLADCLPGRSHIYACSRMCVFACVPACALHVTPLVFGSCFTELAFLCVNTRDLDALVGLLTPTPRASPSSADNTVLLLTIPLLPLAVGPYLLSLVGPIACLAWPIFIPARGGYLPLPQEASDSARPRRALQAAGPSHTHPLRAPAHGDVHVALLLVGPTPHDLAGGGVVRSHVLLRQVPHP
jgi:hypothetical protein